MTLHRVVPQSRAKSISVAGTPQRILPANIPGTVDRRSSAGVKGGC